MNAFTKAALFFPSWTQCWFVLQKETAAGTSSHITQQSKPCSQGRGEECAQPCWSQVLQLILAEVLRLERGHREEHGAPGLLCSSEQEF